MRFQGNLVLAGQLNVKAAGDDGTISASCIAVSGNFTLHPEARLSIQGCQNDGYNLGEDAGQGGCLHVGGDAELHGGQLLLHRCNARNGFGGGMYVKGRTGICCFDLETRRLRTLAPEEL